MKADNLENMLFERLLYKSPLLISLLDLDLVASVLDHAVRQDKFVSSLLGFKKQEKEALVFFHYE